MTKEEKLQTEVITTEQAIYCMNHQYNYEKYECDYCPYCLLCEEKGIEGKMIKMAIKALEENEGLKKEVDSAKHSQAIVSALYNNLFDAHKKLEEEIDKAIAELVQLREERAKLKEKLLFLEPKAELEKEELQRAIQKAREELQSLRGCSCSCSDGIIDDVEEILDKYLGEKLERGETDGRD